MWVGDWADCSCRGGIQQRAAALLTQMRVQAAGAVEIGQQPRHGQPSSTQRRAIRRELTLGALLARVERHGSQAAGLLEVLVDIVSVKGAIPGAKARLAPKPALDLPHQREEVGRVGLVEWA